MVSCVLASPLERLDGVMQDERLVLVDLEELLSRLGGDRAALVARQRRLVLQQRRRADSKHSETHDFNSAEQPERNTCLVPDIGFASHHQ